MVLNNETQPKQKKTNLYIILGILTVLILVIVGYSISRAREAKRQEEIKQTKYNAYLNFFQQSPNQLQFKIDPAMVMESKACETNSTNGIRSKEELTKQKEQLDKILALDWQPNERIGEEWTFYHIDHSARQYRDILIQAIHPEQNNTAVENDANNQPIICSLYGSNSVYTLFEDNFYKLFYNTTEKNNLESHQFHIEATAKTFQNVQQAFSAFKRTQEHRNSFEFAEKELNSSLQKETLLKRDDFATLDILIRGMEDPEVYRRYAADIRDKIMLVKQLQYSFGAIAANNGVSSPAITNSLMEDRTNYTKLYRDLVSSFENSVAELRPEFEAFKEFHGMVTDWYNTYDRWLAKPDIEKTHAELETKYNALQKWYLLNMHTFNEESSATEDSKTEKL